MTKEFSHVLDSKPRTFCVLLGVDTDILQFEVVSTYSLYLENLLIMYLCQIYFVSVVLLASFYFRHSAKHSGDKNLAGDASEGGKYLNDWSRMEKTNLRSCIGSISSWFLPTHTYVRT